MKLKNRYVRAWGVLVGKDEHDGLLECPYLDHDAIEGLKEDIAERTLEKLENKMYLKVGQGVVRKLIWLLGFSIISTAAYLHSKGII